MLEIGDPEDEALVAGSGEIIWSSPGDSGGERPGRTLARQKTLTAESAWRAGRPQRGWGRVRVKTF